MKINLKRHAQAPYRIAVIHGGPGAGGGMASVAKELAKFCGVLEPLQTEDSIAGEIQELKIILEENNNLPVILIGHSWGAWLVALFAAQYPSYVKKLILVSSAPFEEKYAINIMKTRLDRLNEKDKQQVQSIAEKLNDPMIQDADIKQLMKFIAEVDSYHSQFYEEGQNFDIDIYRKVSSASLFL